MDYYEKKEVLRSSQLLSNYKTSLLFIAKFIGLYLLWELAYELYLKPQGWLDIPVIENTIDISAWLMESIGYQITTDHRTIILENTPGLWIGDPCDGVDLFALFTIFIISFPSSILQKLIWIPIGVLLIHIANIIRISALLLLQFYAPSTLEFNHTYTFTFLIYIFILWLWYVWVKRVHSTKD